MKKGLRWRYQAGRVTHRGMFYVRQLAMLGNRRLRLPLYYTGLTNRAVIRWEDGRSETVSLARDYSAEITPRIPAAGRVWFTVGAPDSN